MERLSSRIQELNRLIQIGQTVAAMERFYADDVRMQENGDVPRLGKAVCLAHEERMLAGIAAYSATLLNQAVDEGNGVVFSEWCFETTSQTGKRYKLTEVSVQHWHDELIQSETFYYKNILTLP